MSKRGAEAQVKEAVVVADETQESEEGGYYAKGSKKAKRASKVDIEWYTREELARQVDDDRTKTTLKIMSWNIAGLRPPSRKPTLEALVKKHDPDVICIQETKIQDIHEKDHENYLVGYDAYFTSSTAKKGYSGLVTFVKSGKGDKKKAAQKSMTSFFAGGSDSSSSSSSSSSLVAASSSTLDASIASMLEIKSITKDIDDPAHKGESKRIFSNEGRTMTIEFEKFHLVGAYVPNSGAKLERLSFREKEWGPYITEHLKKLNQTKPVIYAGDLNVCHLDYDIWNFQDKPKKYAGITDEERADYSKMLDQGFVDSFRHFHPDAKGQFTWWSQRNPNARSENKGLRLDYFVCSQDLVTQGAGPKIHDCYILQDECEGVSDHCPLVLTLKV